MADKNINAITEEYCYELYKTRPENRENTLEEYFNEICGEAKEEKSIIQ